MSPEESQLQAVDELNGVDLELLPPSSIDIIERCDARAWGEPALEIAAPGMLYSYDGVDESNTFLSFKDTGAASPRQRSLSNFTVIPELDGDQAQCLLRSLMAPLPQPATHIAETEEGHAEKWSDEGQWAEQSYDEEGHSENWSGECHTSGEGQWGEWWSSDEQGMLPYMVPVVFPTDEEFKAPPPPAKGSFKPAWCYGSTWPFTHAPTTLVLKHLPPELTQSELLMVLDKQGFNGFYDFVFLSVNLRTGKSRREAIVNLTRHSYGLALAAKMHEFNDFGVETSHGAGCRVEWSLPLQGLTEHIEHYRNHPNMHPDAPDDLRPAIFAFGWQVPFPPAMY